MMTVVGLLHDNSHYRRHKGQRTPLEAFIGSFLLTLSFSSETKISLFLVRSIHLKFWDVLLRYASTKAIINIITTTTITTTTTIIITPPSSPSSCSDMPRSTRTWASSNLGETTWKAWDMSSCTSTGAHCHGRD